MKWERGAISSPGCVAAVLAMLFAASLSGAPTAGVPVAVPASVAVLQSTVVKVSCLMTTADQGTRVHPGSVNLLEVSDTDQPIRILGKMRDDGAQGDDTAADGVFTFRVALNRPTPGTVRIRCSAALLGVIERFLSPVLTIPFVEPAPVILPSISVAPAQGEQGQTISLVITGQNTSFAQSTSVVSLGPGIAINSIQVTSPTSLTAQISIMDTAAIGPRNVSVTTGSEVVNLTNGFSVKVGTPLLTSITPATGRQGETVNVAIAGKFTNFVQGTSVASFGAGITVNNLIITSTTAASANLTLAIGAAPGYRTVTLTTGAEVVSCSNCFALNPGTPVLLTLTPNSGQQGQVNLNVALTGQFTGWVQGTSSASFGTGITVNSLTVTSATAATANITIAAGATLGNRNVSVTTGSEVVTLTNGFTVTNGSPLLVTVNPNTGQQGQANFSVALTGQYTNFSQTSSQVSFGAGVTVNSATVASATGLTAIISVAPGAVVGPRTVTVTTGAEVVSLANGFTVGAGTPVLLTVNPNTGQQGQANFSVALTGQYTNFAQASSQVNFGAGVTVNSITVASATGLTANISVAPGAGVGARTVTVTTGAEVVSLANGFTVGAGTPVLTVSPNTGQQGQTNLSVALAGQYTNFAQASSQVNFGAGVTVHSITVASATGLTANISIAAGASVGARTVSVTTGAEVVSLANGFTVQPSAVPCFLPPAGLIGWWPGDGNSKDIWGGLDGVTPTGVLFQTGIVGSAFGFSESSQ